MTEHTHQTAPRQFVDATGIRFAYRPLADRVVPLHQTRHKSRASVHIRFRSFPYGHMPVT